MEEDIGGRWGIGRLTAAAFDSGGAGGICRASGKPAEGAPGIGAGHTKGGSRQATLLPTYLPMNLPTNLGIQEIPQLETFFSSDGNSGDSLDLLAPFGGLEKGDLGGTGAEEPATLAFQPGKA